MLVPKREPVFAVVVPNRPWDLELLSNENRPPLGFGWSDPLFTKGFESERESKGSGLQRFIEWDLRI